MSVSSPPASVSRRQSILGVPVDSLSLSETVERARLAIVERRRLQHVALNTAKLVTMRSNALLWDDVTQSDIVSADGMGIVWGCRLLGVSLPERVTGIDLMGELLALSEREGFRPYILGAAPDVLGMACDVIARKHPRLRLAGSHHGYFSDEEAPALVERIRESKPDLLFVAMSTPRKEQFLHRYRDELGAPFMMGVGGSVDVIAGVTRRAPAWMQRAGLEWLFRILQEPRRMWRRYVSTNSVFAWLMFRALLARAAGAGAR